MDRIGLLWLRCCFVQQEYLPGIHPRIFSTSSCSFCGKGWKVEVWIQNKHYWDSLILGAKFLSGWRFTMIQWWFMWVICKSTFLDDCGPLDYLPLALSPHPKSTITRNWLKDLKESLAIWTWHAISVNHQLLPVVTQLHHPNGAQPLKKGHE